MPIQAQKYEKYWKSKNDLKCRLGTLNKELWARYVFFINLKFDDCQTSVNQQKSKQHEKWNFGREKIKKFNI